MDIKIFTILRRKLNKTFSFLSRQARINNYLQAVEIPKLQLGSGENILQGWLNTDLDPSKNTVFLDARRSFPFRDNIFSYIFCEHLIEHLDYQEGEFMLRECFRSLKPGGKIRIATPDLKFLIELYAPEKNEIQKRYISWATDSFLPGLKIYKDIFIINNFFQNWGHKFIYDFETLNNALGKAGFINIIDFCAGSSKDVNFQNIESHGKCIPDEFNKLETMAIEAEKPS